MSSATEVEKYEVFNNWADGIWKNKDRPEYEADLWVNQDRNRIAMQMIGDLGKGKRVLAVGAAIWVDAALMAALKPKEPLITDLLPMKGIDLCCDAQYLPFKDETIDMILCRELIEHVWDDTLMFTEAYRVLKPGGYLFVTTPNMLNQLPDCYWHKQGYMPRMLLQRLRHFKFRMVKKRGNAPNLYHSLMPLAKQGTKAPVLDEFKFLAQLFDHCRTSYYFGTQLMVLARKVAA